MRFHWEHNSIAFWDNRASPSSHDPELDWKPNNLRSWLIRLCLTFGQQFDMRWELLLMGRSHNQSKTTNMRLVKLLKIGRSRFLKSKALIWVWRITLQSHEDTTTSDNSEVDLTRKQFDVNAINQSHFDKLRDWIWRSSDIDQIGKTNSKVIYDCRSMIHLRSTMIATAHVNT